MDEGGVMAWSGVVCAASRHPASLAREVENLAYFLLPASVRQRL
jgi:hypothetical protein